MSKNINGKVVFNESWLGDNDLKPGCSREMTVIKLFVFYATTVLLILQNWV